MDTIKIMFLFCVARSYDYGRQGLGEEYGAYGGYGDYGSYDYSGGDSYDGTPIDGITRGAIHNCRCLPIHTKCTNYCTPPN